MRHETLRRLSDHIPRDPESLAVLFRQGSDTAPAYAQRFLERARQLPRTFYEPALCERYLHGLKPSLRTKCMFDLSNKPWQTLTGLMSHSYVEERKMHAMHCCNHEP